MVVHVYESSVRCSVSLCDDCTVSRVIAVTVGVEKKEAGVALVKGQLLDARTRHLGQQWQSGVARPETILYWYYIPGL